MASIGVMDPVVIVLADGDSDAALSNARGHLFEAFVARLLQMFGFREPTTSNLNVRRDGIELDVTAAHELTQLPAIAECKAYTSPVSAAMLGTFHSKLVTARYAKPETQGFFVALPKLTSNGQEQADLISAHDPRFKVLNAADVVELLKSRGTITPCPAVDILTSDPAVVVSDQGVYAACIELEPSSREPLRALLWSATGTVPKPVLEGLARHSYTQSVTVVDASTPATEPVAVQIAEPEPPPLIVTVLGSTSDFEYQLPASPKFFVGRKALVDELESALMSGVGVIVLNAQSGWGKSSAALRLQALAFQHNGYALIIDSRTAAYRRFVTDAVRRAAQEAEHSGALALPSDASWASLASALRTLRDAEWFGGPLVVFFDQFENVFRDEALTREFRDLALGARDLKDRLLVGFAWKTDLVGWTESHPYQLRDEIRSNARVLTIGPLGVAEIDTLLRRLEKALGQSLARDLRTRLREYSQGLPWLFKKLAGHLLHEVEQGTTQEKLAAEALNVQNLFEADLAELGPSEHEALRHIARHAPIAISEVMERVTGPVVETLVNRRLVVQVGERLDTYWDIFRDYLNTGRVPIEDSYILRQSPTSVTRLLREVILDDGDSSVPDLGARMGTSENAVFNLSRELRLLGATAYETNRVRVLPEIWEAPDRELELRRRVAGSLRRHRAYSAFVALAERNGSVSMAEYAAELQNLFPAVEVRSSTWTSYARVFLQWFEYAGLVLAKGSQWQPAAEGSLGTGELLGGRVARRTKGAWPQRAPGPAIRLLLRIARGEVSENEDKRSLRDLEVLKAIDFDPTGAPRLRAPTLVGRDGVVPDQLWKLMLGVPGSPEGLAVLRGDPSVGNLEVGRAVQQALGAEWRDGTVRAVGKCLRAWARLAGLDVGRAKGP